MFSDDEALHFHKHPVPGKLGMVATKPMTTQRDLALAYSPGVAVPVEKIAQNPDAVYDYTSKGNMVAVVSNGTAILGLGNLGAAASKPVMEGKSVLFKRFADVDSIDLEIEEEDVDAFVECVARFGNSFGGINLEDIRGPDCFIIESRLRDRLKIPVFHDDQHGTAIIAAAGMINACKLTDRDISDLKVVTLGAGAAGIAVTELIKAMGVKHENVLMLDRKGVIHADRDDLDQWKRRHAVETSKRSLDDAMEGADLFLGLAVKDAVSREMVASMAANPIIFAMANPDPEITPEEVAEVRDDAIMATGRSDYPNQVNNVLGFPYIFRGALDVRAEAINDEMKIAAARALARLAREDVPDEVAAAYHGKRPSFGRDYIIPVPFDPRLISYIPSLVAQAAMDSGVARKPITDMKAYKEQLARRLDPTAGLIQRIQGAVSEEQKRIVFAEGEEPSVIRAAYQFKTSELGVPILIGREKTIQQNMRMIGLDPAEAQIEIKNARLSDRNHIYVDYLYRKHQRNGYLRRDIQRMINQDRNIFGASLVVHGEADGMVTGTTRNFGTAFDEIMRVVDQREDERVMAISIMIAGGQTLVMGDTNINELPTAEELVDITIETARAARSLGFEPRVALLSYSTFGNPLGERSDKMRKAMEILDSREDIDFQYDGEMAVDVALDPLARQQYPFLRLDGPANVLIAPAIHSASISSKLLEALGNATIIGPVLLGLEKSVQICRVGATVSEIVNMAMLAAMDLDTRSRALKPVK